MVVWWLLVVAVIHPTAAHPFVTNEETTVSYQGTSANGIDQFLGITYGEDTSGIHRFAPPQPFLSPNGSVIDATRPGAACPQAVKPIIPPMSDVTFQSEDCLNLRIARPADENVHDGPMPVMVFIHGGKRTSDDVNGEMSNRC